MTKRVMKFADDHLGIMECCVCGHIHQPMIISGGRLSRGSWQCANGCKLETKSTNEHISTSSNEDDN